jgi:DNA-binding NarL/FixJ family response regulator
VILDLNIPGSIGGGEVAARILALDKNAKLFVSSGNENDPVMISYTQYGFTGKLAKPFLYADAVKLVKLID